MKPETWKVKKIFKHQIHFRMVSNFINIYCNLFMVQKFSKKELLASSSLVLSLTISFESEPSATYFFLNIFKNLLFPGASKSNLRASRGSIYRRALVLISAQVPVNIARSPIQLKAWCRRPKKKPNRNRPT